MKRYLISLMATVVIVATVVIAWTPIAKAGHLPPFDDCLDFCENQAICQCAKILGGSLRLTVCNINALCVNSQCVCDPVDPICKPWEIGVVTQEFPPDPPIANNCQPGG